MTGPLPLQDGTVLTARAARRGKGAAVATLPLRYLRKDLAMHELTRVRAYARLIIAIAAEPDLRGTERSDAIDALVDRMVDTAPGDHDCQSVGRYCEACTVPA